jgi:competence protein ComEC
MLANRQIDIIKIGHHGSDDAVRGEQLRQLSPQLALISVGNNNRYCHPTKETMQTLADANLPILCTKDYGDVTIEFEADGFNVRCAKILE